MGRHVVAMGVSGMVDLFVYKRMAHLNIRWRWMSLRRWKWWWWWWW